MAPDVGYWSLNITAWRVEIMGGGGGIYAFGKVIPFFSFFFFFEIRVLDRNNFSVDIV